MKNIYIITLFMFFCNKLTSQVDCVQDLKQYLIAYNYIITDSINNNEVIAVSDSIVDIDRELFPDKLINFPEEKEKLNKYRENKAYIWDASYYSPCLNVLFCKNNNASKVLFFSKIEDNMLLADLLPYKDKFSMFNYDRMASQNIGLTYLFILGSDGEIKGFFKHSIIYD